MKEEPDEYLYQTSVRFNAIYVLESLAPGQPKTGQDIFDLVVYPIKAQLGEMYVEFASIPTREKLLEQLAKIAHSARVGNHYPIVHIEAHGDPTGIDLADGTSITWRELIPAFTGINFACKNNLMVVAISCYGWHLTASLMPSDRAPVFMLVGPPETMTAAKLFDATSRFYEGLVSSFDVNRALEAMNGQLPFAQWPIRPATAEILYCRVFRQYVEELCSPDILRDREDHLVARITQARSLSVLESAALRLEVRRDLADHRAAYERHQKHFLMLDLFPADSGRFGLNCDRCVSKQVHDSL